MPAPPSRRPPPSGARDTLAASATRAGGERSGETAGPEDAAASERSVRPPASTPASKVAREAVTARSAAIATERLTKRYGATLALDELDLTVREGEVYGYLGPNGAGKTTTIRLLLGLHRPSSGRALLFGVDAWRDPVKAHHRLAYVPGEPFLWPALTSGETFEFLARLHDGTDIAYREVLVKRFDLDTRKKIRALSKGNRQKVQLIAALATRADLLLLDEPTSGLDPLMEMAFRECIIEAKQRGQTVLLSSHILSEVEAVCDRVGILRDGRLVDEGTLDQLRHLSAQTVEVTFTGPAPVLAPLAGVDVANAGSNALRFEVSGSIGPLIAALAEHPVAMLTSREPSLEEIFLHHYEGADGSSAH
jgi:ABC-2 type transport system ATP-binding protein